MFKSFKERRLKKKLLKAYKLVNKDLQKYSDLTFKEYTKAYEEIITRYSVNSPQRKEMYNLKVERKTLEGEDFRNQYLIKSCMIRNFDFDKIFMFLSTINKLNEIRYNLLYTRKLKSIIIEESFKKMNH